ncbi:GNAT family N-acetyltransferase [Aerosticca soli]|uniref:GNAT family N-acetyltransferase n=1 Tax=Aerosticca soli TaxID=2010829 RepID=UPI000F84D2F3|nr:GNAT family N-acetyltransferase [Aerosticca soli]
MLAKRFPESVGPFLPSEISRVEATYRGQLEPASLIEHFIAYPPEGFFAERAVQGMPGFIMAFDLLTTADDALRRKVMHWPFYRRWSGLLRWRTRFIGSTVSEYAPLPFLADPIKLVDELLQTYGNECPLLIVKDLPCDSPLLDASDNAFAQTFVATCKRQGWIDVEGQALAYLSLDFNDVQAYLARLSASRRKDLRRKLRAIDRLEVDIIPTGDDRFHKPEVLADFYALYRNVYAQSQVHFDLLSMDFFRALLQDANNRGIVFVYRHHGEMIGWNLCYEYSGKLIDKYIGLAYPAARENNLYFVSWIRNIDYALSRGLRHYVAGWTDATVKRDLGASFTMTRHLVHVRSSLLRGLLRRLAPSFAGESVAVQPA